MAAIFQELVLTWGGKEYRVAPSMALLNKIEQQGVSLSGIILRTAEGNPPLSHIATAVFYFLTAAGARVTWEDVYAEVAQFREDVLAETINAIRLAAFPYSGKAAAPETPAPPATPPAGARTSRPIGGRTTTSPRKRGG